MVPGAGRRFVLAGPNGPRPVKGFDEDALSGTAGRFAFCDKNQLEIELPLPGSTNLVFILDKWYLWW